MALKFLDSTNNGGLFGGSAWNGRKLPSQALVFGSPFFFCAPPGFEKLSGESLPFPSCEVHVFVHPLDPIAHLQGPKPQPIEQLFPNAIAWGAKPVIASFAVCLFKTLIVERDFILIPSLYNKCVFLPCVFRYFYEADYTYFQLQSAHALLLKDFLFKS